MVLSLQSCDAKPKGLFQKPVHKKARRFIKRYEAEASSTNCNACRGKDATRGKYIKGNNDRCPGLVELACQLLEEFL